MALWDKSRRAAAARSGVDPQPLLSPEHHYDEPTSSKRAGRKAGNLELEDPEQYQLEDTPAQQAWRYAQYGLWALLILAGVGMSIAALILALDDDTLHVCNAGTGNSALDLPSCPTGSSVTGHTLVYGEAGHPHRAFVRRVAEGVGVDIEPFPDSHILVNVLVESLSPELVVDESGGTPNAVTLELFLDGLNVTTILADECTIAGNGTAADPVHLDFTDPNSSGLDPLDVEPTAGLKITKIIPEHHCNASTNFWIEFPYAGHGLCVGDEHVCPNDGTMDRSSVLGGLNNGFVNASTSVIGAGEFNYANDTIDSGVFAGRENAILNSAQSVIVGGQENLIANVSGGDSGIVAGFGNQILAGDDNFIGAGEDNTNNGDESGIVAGDGNTIQENAGQCGILAGSSNIVGNLSTSSAIIAGQDNEIATDGNDVDNSVILGGINNAINNVSNSAILAGSNILLNNDLHDSNTAATQNLLIASSLKTTHYVIPNSTPYVADQDDYLILINTTDLGATAVNLPAGLPDGMHIIVKDTGDASGDTISITAIGEFMFPWSGAPALGGTQTITQQGGVVELIRTAIGWMVVSSR